MGFIIGVDIAKFSVLDSIEKSIPMITKQKIQIFERYHGDLDALSRIGSDKENQLFENEDWFLIESFLQDIDLMNQGLVNEDYINERMAEMRDKCDEYSLGWFESKMHIRKK